VNWSKSMAAGVAFAIVSSLVAIGCSEDSSVYDDPRRIVDPEQVPETKRIRRLTADQFFASLEVATGQEWDDEEQFAATLGRPDFAEVTVEGREMSVGFAKLAGDAARQTCRRAVEQDRDTADKVLRDIPVTFPILFDEQNQVSELYDVTAMPMTVLVDRNGEIRFMHKGYKPGYEAQYEQQIRALVKE